MPRSTLLKILAPILVLGSAGLIAGFLVLHPKAAVTQDVQGKRPVVSVERVTMQTVAVPIHVYGVISPRVEIDLVAQVAGTITAVHPAWSTNGFFKKDEVLLQIDPRDYDVAIAEAEAQAAEARKIWHKEVAEAEQAKSDWHEMGEGKVSPYVLHKPQRAAAYAQLQATQAKLRQARLNRERTSLRAPFDGRIRESRGVAIGQYIGATTSVGRIYPSDALRVRLPLRDNELALIDLPFDSRDHAASERSTITLTASFAGHQSQYTARFVALEGSIDEKTRLAVLIAELDDPFGLAKQTNRPLLTLGQAVDAILPGRPFDNIVVLPTSALHGEDHVLVLDEAARMHARPVKLLRRERDRLLVEQGLNADELVVVSAIEEVEGMQVSLDTSRDRLSETGCKVPDCTKAVEPNPKSKN